MLFDKYAWGLDAPRHVDPGRMGIFLRRFRAVPALAVFGGVALHSQDGKRPGGPMV